MGGVIHIHYRGCGHLHTLQRVGHSHTLQRVGSFTYITEGVVIYIHYRGCGHLHTLQRVGSFTYITEGVVIYIHYRGCGHSHTLQRVGTTPAASCSSNYMYLTLPPAWILWSHYFHVCMFSSGIPVSP